MSSLHVIGINGSPSRSSRSRALLLVALDALRAAGAHAEVVDLGDLEADALLARAKSPAVDVAIAGVARAHVVVASTPVYRATYTGLLKSFFDLLPLRALDGKVALGIATAASPGHEGVIDHGFRPLFASLEAIATPTGIFATDDAFTDGVPTDQLAERVTRAATDAYRLAAALRAVPAYATS